MEPGEHPIVNRPKRPDWLWNKDISLMFEDEREQAQEYIEWQEKERDRLEAAIRQKDNALEVCEGRRWEAEERIEALTLEHLDYQDIENVER